MGKEILDILSKEIEIAKKEFREKVENIGKYFGFSKTGIVVKSDAVISFSYEEIRDSEFKIESDGNTPKRYVDTIHDNDMSKILRFILCPNLSDEDFLFCESFYNSREENYKKFELVKDLFPERITAGIINFSTPESRLDFVKKTSYSKDAQHYTVDYPIKVDVIKNENGDNIGIKFTNVRTGEVLSENGKLNLVVNGIVKLEE
jgi:hypothetical protein